MAKLTLIGLYNYTEGSEHPLFEKLSMPEGVEKDVVINNILLKGGEFETLYSDPDFIRESIGLWSRKWSRTFTKWVEALSLEYNPIENYDRIEETTITDNGSTSNTEHGTGNQTITRESDGTSIDTSSNSNTGSTTNKISAFNADTMQNDTSSDVSNNSTVNGETTLHNEGSDITTSLHDVSGSTTSQNTQIHTSRIHGNIGVTTSSAMLLESLSAAEWNLYDHIADVFLSEFVIPIY